MLRRLLGSVFTTQSTLEPRDEKRAANGLLVDGVCSSSMATLQGGPFLAAFAIALGASNYEVGLIASIGFLSQFSQLAGLFLVRKFPRRRGIVVVSAGISRLLWLLILMIPVLFVDRGVTFLLQWLLIIAVVGAVAGPAWNSLIRDIVPQSIMGRLFSRRMILGTAFALGFTLLGGFFVDYWKGWFPDYALYGYSILFAIGLVFGLVGLTAVARLPEPRMEAPESQSPADLLLRPVKDRNFQGLLKYIAFWNFAINLAGPFFIVYLLQRIGLPLSMVTMLVVTSQVTNLVFLRIWGKLADKYSNKSVLRVSGPLFLLAVLLWTFTTMPDRHMLTLPLLFAIHVLSGVSTAGVSLATANIALKLSPQGQAHSYMTVYGLAGAVTGAVAPLLGGVLADFFASRALSIPIQWSDEGGQVSVYAIHLRALDFLFLLTFVTGLVSLRFLSKVAESGEVDETVVRKELLSETFATVRTVSTMPGLRHLVAGPVSAAYRLINRSDEESEPPGQA
jgi:MFS family permease